MAKSPHAAAAANRRMLADRANRMRNLQAPAVATVAVIRAEIDTAYARKAEPQGPKFPALKYRREPPPMLQLTGESRDSIKVTASRGNIRLYAMDRVFMHAAGGVFQGRPNPPKRSVLPFELRDGKWMAKPHILALHQKHIKQWIETGRV